MSSPLILLTFIFGFIQLDKNPLLKQIVDNKGKFKVEYRIAPKETSIKKVKTSATTASVKWKKQKKNITGYQLQYSPSESFGALNKVVTLKGKNKTSYKIKNLRIDGIYYVRVRTYKTVKGEKVVSKWSKPKRFRTDIPV